MQQITWVKATASFANGNCVEIATLPDGMIGIRDSKSPQGPILRFTPGEWNAFLNGAQRGEFDQPGRCRLPDGSATHQRHPPTDHQLAGTDEADTPRPQPGPAELRADPSRTASHHPQPSRIASKTR